MPKLHELLAVQDNLKGQATKTWTDLKATFTGKRHLFEESKKTFQPTEADKPVEQVEEKSLQTTVSKEIDWVNKHIAKAIDIGYQVDLANSKAHADVTLESGELLLKGVPATALLQLEKRLGEIQDLITTIPTLDPAKGFTPDPDRGFGIYKAREVRKEKTKKIDQPVTIAKATDKHPEQAVLKTYDVPVGHILEQEWSALITPAKKSELLDQVEEVRRAVKTARSLANNIEVDVKDSKIGSTVLEYIFAPLHNSI